MYARIHHYTIIGLLLTALLVLSGCGTLDVGVEPAGQATATEATVMEPTAMPTAITPEATRTAAPTATVPAAQPTSAATGLPFEAATFRSDSYGFEFSYPAIWNLSDLGVIGSRASAVQFFDGDTVAMQMTLYQWDPQNDLVAYNDHRKTAWLASGMTLLAEEDWLLESDHPAVSFVMQSQAGDEAFFFFTPIADRYLELSGDQDMELLGAIARTVRLTESVSGGTTGTISDTAADTLGCRTSVAERTSEWVACNVMDGLISRNTAALPGFMADPFIIGYWRSEGISLTPNEGIAEMSNSMLPADPAVYPLAFTVDRSAFPPLQGIPVEGLFGPDVAIAHIIYSEGWGLDGQGAVLIFIAQNPSGGFYWHGLVYSFEHFDR